MEFNDSMEYTKTEIQRIFPQLQHGGICHKKIKNVSIIGQGGGDSSYLRGHRSRGYGYCRGRGGYIRNVRGVHGG